MFRGSSLQEIDAKGRMSIPDRFLDKIRSSQKKHLMMTIINEERCIFVYDYNEWQKLLQRVHENKENLKFEPYMESVAIKCGIDDLERLTIPPNFIEYTAIKKEIVVTGMLEHFEIWSKEFWDTAQKKFQTLLREDIASLSL